MQYDDTDRDWQQFGQTDPYWAVITVDDYRKDNLTADGLDRFYDSGETHVRWFFDVVRRHIDEGFAPRSALDFGCGVGRLALPLARRCRSVVPPALDTPDPAEPSSGAFRRRTSGARIRAIPP